MGHNLAGVRDSLPDVDQAVPDRKQVRHSLTYGVRPHGARQIAHNTQTLSI